MHFTFRNVNDAFRELVKRFHLWQPDVRDLLICSSTSRNGNVLYIQEPMIITYTHPRERVLFNQARDCNPFFHVYEALWMLAGRNDVAPLKYYNSNIANYSDDGETFNGAYGHRWRHCQIEKPYSVECEYLSGEEGGGRVVNQLRILIDHLKAVPDSRRAVLQMWNVEDDLLKIGTPRKTTTEANKEFRTFDPDPNYSKDVCCNLSVCFSVRRWEESLPYSYRGETFHECRHHTCLDMTVFNRSNDLIWGALGANVVHFSFLQEYVAACLGVEVGVYNQISNNLHVYQNDKWQPEKWLAEYEDVRSNYDPGICDKIFEARANAEYRTKGALHHDQQLDAPLPLVKDPATFDAELPKFVEWQYTEGVLQGAKPILWQEPFFQHVAQPLLTAFYMHKNRDYEAAMQWASSITADDWRIAATNWILKRKAMYENRTHV